MMDIDDFWIKPGDLAWGAEAGKPPLGFIDLNASPRRTGAMPAPSFPVIGVGDASHPLAKRLDAVIEPPFSPAMLIRSVQARPQAAAVAVHLLRSLDKAPMELALIQESFAYGLLQGSREHAAWLAARQKSAKPSSPGDVRLGRDGETLEIVLNRPSERNAIDYKMRDALREAFLLAALDRDIRRVVLRGAGKAFCAGGDLGEFGTTRDPAEAHLIRIQTLPAFVIARCAEKFEVFIQGACTGAGLEMAAFARRIAASKNAWFQLPELAMGLIPGAGGCVSVSRRIGRQRTALLILSGKRISAQTALRWGLIDSIMDDDAANEARANIVR
jgi:enoyl-CoA hydratase/carnithine racemase